MFNTCGIGRIALIGIAAVPVMTVAYKDGPPVGHTGGFGEPTCHSCHFEGPLNSTDASAELLGPPSMYTPDSTYVLTVRVSRKGLGAGGFSMSGRFRDGRQAGQFEAVDDRVVVRLDSNGVQYAMHTLAGSKPASIDSLAWSLLWIAPGGADTVLLNLAANAANGDDSPFGDLIEVRSIDLTSADP